MRTESPKQLPSDVIVLARFSFQLLFVPALFSIGAFGMMVASHNDALVAAREQWVTGTIVSREPHNHNRYGYQFQVKGETFSGWETPQKDEPKIGQSVRVYFDAQSPAKNALTDFADLADTSRARGIVMLVMSGIFVPVVLLLDRTLGKRRPEKI
jgi:hypothetical protein